MSLYHIHFTGVDHEPDEANATLEVEAANEQEAREKFAQLVDESVIIHDVERVAKSFKDWCKDNGRTGTSSQDEHDYVHYVDEQFEEEVVIP